MKKIVSNAAHIEQDQIGLRISLRRLNRANSIGLALSLRYQKTVAKCVDRFRAEGIVGLRDRSSRPPFIAEPNPARHSRRGRELAPRAQDPGAHRWPARHLRGQRLPYPQT